MLPDIHARGFDNLAVCCHTNLLSTQLQSNHPKNTTCMFVMFGANTMFQVSHLFSSLVVEWLKPSAGVRPLFLVRQALTAVRTLAASTLPSSTPHWSKLFRPQMNPCMFRVNRFQVLTAYYSTSLNTCTILCHRSANCVWLLPCKQALPTSSTDTDGENSRSRTPAAVVTQPI